MSHTVSHSKNPSFAILSTGSQFVHLEQRVGSIDDSLVSMGVSHVRFLEEIKSRNNIPGFLQLRRLFFDDKNGAYSCVVDHLIHKGGSSNINEFIKQLIEIRPGQTTVVDLVIIEENFDSDHFDKNHQKFYMNERVIPWVGEFDKYIYNRIIEEKH